MSFLAIQYGFVGRWLNPGRETVGALDLGGASTQIAFETSETVENKDNVMELELYGQPHRIYTHSFLCYGQDQFLRKLLAHFIQVMLSLIVTYVVEKPQDFHDFMQLTCHVVLHNRNILTFWEKVAFLQRVK